MTAANYQELYVIKSHGARLCGMEVGIVHDQRRILVTGGSRALRICESERQERTAGSYRMSAES